jgi:hypothetical protein
MSNVAVEFEDSSIQLISDKAAIYNGREVTLPFAQGGVEMRMASSVMILGMN